MKTMIKETLFIRAWGFLKIPLIYFLRPSILEMTDERMVMKIPLNRRSKNHLNSMYFGALCVGADCAGGMIAMKLIRESGHDISLVFKDFQASFLKRPEADVHFICEVGSEIKKLIDRTVKSGERENLAVPVIATCPSKFGNEPVAQFTLTLSLKKRK